MNLADYERIVQDEDLVEKIGFNTFYAMGRARDPHFRARWASVSKHEKEAAGKIGLEAIYTLVDDYTTPGCDCRFCTWEEETSHGRPIMCEQRWRELSPEVRSEISESVND